MANKSTFLYLLLLAFLPGFAISSSKYKEPIGPKCETFTRYEQLIVNKTIFLVVNGVAGDKYYPFGTIFVLNIDLTRTRNPSSKVIGNNQGMVVTTSFDGDSGIVMDTFTPNLSDKKSRISAQGVVSKIRPSNVSVTGGTGKYTGADGYLTYTTLFSNKFMATVKIDFYICLPPYAPYALEGY